MTGEPEQFGCASLKCAARKDCKRNPATWGTGDDD